MAAKLYVFIVPSNVLLAHLAVVVAGSIWNGNILLDLPLGAVCMMHSIILLAKIRPQYSWLLVDLPVTCSLRWYLMVD